MSEKGPCIVCGKTDYPLSMGGPSICPSCDCGIPPEVSKLESQLSAAQEEIKEAHNDCIRLQQEINCLRMEPCQLPHCITLQHHHQKMREALQDIIDGMTEKIKDTFAKEALAADTEKETT